MTQPHPDVEFGSQHRVADRERPQHACVAGVGEVGELADPRGWPRRGPARRRGRPARAARFASASRCPRSDPSAGAPWPLRRGHAPLRLLAGGLAEHRACLDANVFRLVAPFEPAFYDGVLNGWVPKVCAGGCRLSDGDGHGGVIRPFPGARGPPPTMTTSSSGPRGGPNSYGAPSASPLQCPTGHPRSDHPVTPWPPPSFPDLYQLETIMR